VQIIDNISGTVRYPFEAEADILTMQAVLWEPINRRVLAHAGLKEGMTVLV